ncbi:MAG: glycoside hydrolase family 3 C-terminal domain-containing protein, partial [Polyangia bacterium]
GKSTVYPVAMARGAAFDLDLEYRIGLAMGDEMVAAGQTMLLAPTVNILRHPLWGRAQETYGEDVFLLGRLGSANVVGIQQYVPACVKHYAANNIENNRATQNAQMDEQTLREIYARHFEMIVKEGGVACVMAAYNQVNGTNSTQNKHLLTDILRTDFGFKGFVLSDWWAMPGGNALSSVSTDTRKMRAAEAVKAGMDMELPWAMHYGQLESITGAGLPLAVTDLNTSAGLVLEQKLRFKVAAMTGAIGLKPKAANTTFSGGTVSNDEHVAIALEAAVKSMVLLKNANNTLPIKRASVKSIAVVGAKLSYASGMTGINNPGDDSNGGMVDFATSVRTGDVGSSRANAEPAKSVGPFAGIQMAAGSGITVTTGNNAAAAANADFVVVVAGLTPYDEGEEYNRSGDRGSFVLDGKLSANTQNTLIMDVAKLGKPMVVVLEGGSVIDMPWIGMVPAVVMAWYPGMVGGKALGQLLFGDANFSGKLPITWPATGKVTDPGTFSSGLATMMDYYLGYRRYDQMGIVPQFPFGHGLSYATFKYSNLQVPCSDVTKNGVVNVQVDVQNTGTVAGDEVAFLFVSYPGTKRRAGISADYKELKGFYRVSLPAGVTKRITIPLRVADLKYYDASAMAWQVETGPVKIMVGPSSAKTALTLSDTVMVK